MSGSKQMPEDLTPHGEYLDIAEVSVLFKTSPSALYTQRHRGEEPGSLAVRVGKKLLWMRADLDAWWESQKVQASQAEPQG